MPPNDNDRMQENEWSSWSLPLSSTRSIRMGARHSYRNGPLSTVKVISYFLSGHRFIDSVDDCEDLNCIWAMLCYVIYRAADRKSKNRSRQGSLVRRFTSFWRWEPSRIISSMTYHVAVQTPRYRKVESGESLSRNSHYIIRLLWKHCEHMRQPNKHEAG